MKHEPWKDMTDFYAKFKLPRCATPGWPMPDLLKLRLKLILEEVGELVDAAETRDIEGFADALVDLNYVVLGAAMACGMPYPEMWDEVHRANMAKELAGNRPSKRGHTIDLIKPEGWQPPNLKKFL